MASSPPDSLWPVACHPQSSTLVTPKEQQADVLDPWVETVYAQARKSNKEKRDLLTPATHSPTGTKSQRVKLM